MFQQKFKMEVNQDVNKMSSYRNFIFFIVFECEKNIYIHHKRSSSNFSRKGPIIFIWGPKGNILDYVSAKKPYSDYFTNRYGNKADLVIHNHGVGESSCSDKIRELIVLTYEKSPHSLVISIDYSHIVST